MPVLLAAVFMLTPVTAGHGPTPADCVDYWHACAPGNPEGKPAGCFDAGGVLVQPWPCQAVLPPGPVDTD
jgi:hypothetical protein